jgi:hypothetical protein
MRWNGYPYKAKVVDWLPGEADGFNCLEESWNGRFRKVKITLVYYSKVGNALCEMIKLAETCAPHLVGDSILATQTWENETGDVRGFGIKKWQRSLTVERKE